MLGEIPILINFPDLMNNIQPVTDGQYAAFLFSGYSLAITVAFVLSIEFSV